MLSQSVLCFSSPSHAEYTEREYEVKISRNRSGGELTKPRFCGLRAEIVEPLQKVAVSGSGRTRSAEVRVPMLLPSHGRTDILQKHSEGRTIGPHSHPCSVPQNC